MTDFAYSKKFKIFAIVSAVIIAAGMILGTVLHCVKGAFFNYGGEYAGYKSVTVSYFSVEFNKKDDVEKICADAFSAEGVKAYVNQDGETSTNKEIVYKFSASTDGEKLAKAVDAINAKIRETVEGDFVQSGASVSQSEGVLGGGYALWRCAVAIAVIVVVQLIYMLIRYRLAAAVTAFCADIHNFALYAAILALCRIPVDSSALVFGALVILATAFGFGLTCLRLKRNFKNADYAKLSDAEKADKSAGETFKTNILFAGSMLLAAVIIFALALISSTSPTVVLPLTLCAVAAFAAAGYGTSFFAPALYPKVRALFKKPESKPSKKSEN